MKNKTRILRISTKGGTESLAKALRELHSYVRCDLELPSHVSAPNVGDAVGLCQLITTWARRNPEETLRTYVDSADTAAAVREFVTADHGLLAALTASKIVSRAAVDVSREVRAAVDERLKAMNDVHDAARGQKVTLVCADDAPFRPATLYDQLETPVLRSPEGFLDLITTIFQRIVRGPGTTPIQGEHTAFALARALRELFLNTDQWATTDVFGVPMPRSVRLIRIEQVSLSLIDKRGGYGDALFNRYMASERDRRGNDRLRLLEISVFDTGPGLPSRHLRREFPSAYKDWPYSKTELSAGDEYHAVIECLRLHGTASNDSYRGVGLDLVMQLLTAIEAILRVRTGRLELYRDFTTKPYDKASKSTKEPYLLDTVTQSGLLTKRLPVQGTVFTVVFPVVYET